MKENKIRFGVSLAAGLTHLLAAVTAIIYFVMLLNVPLDVDSVGDAFAFILLLPFVIILLIMTSVPQLAFGVGITAAAAQKKRKLCAVFCGIPLLADLIAVIFAFIIGAVLMSTINTAFAVVMLAYAALSLICIALSIAAMVLNISKKYNTDTQNTDTTDTVTE